MKTSYYVYVIFIIYAGATRFFSVEDIHTDMFERIQELRERFPNDKFYYERELVIPV